jgi:hypothetical protein
MAAAGRESLLAARDGGWLAYFQKTHAMNGGVAAISAGDFCVYGLGFLGIRRETYELQ